MRYILTHFPLFVFREFTKKQRLVLHNILCYTGLELRNIGGKI